MPYKTSVFGNAALLWLYFFRWSLQAGHRVLLTMCDPWMTSLVFMSCFSIMAKAAMKIILKTQMIMTITIRYLYLQVRFSRWQPWGQYLVLDTDYDSFTGKQKRFASEPICFEYWRTNRLTESCSCCWNAVVRSKRLSLRFFCYSCVFLLESVGCTPGVPLDHVPSKVLTRTIS